MPKPPATPPAALHRFRPSLRASIWMATLAVILLILVLALTIYHAREKDVVEQYGTQMAAIAKGTAAGIEDLMNGVEKSMILLSRLPSVARTRPGETLRSMRVVYDDLEGKVLYIARLDEKGAVLAGYPASFRNELAGRRLGDETFFRTIRERLAPRRSAEGLRDPVLPRADRARSVLIGVPKFNDRYAFSGVLFAVVSLETILRRYLTPVMEGGPDRYAVLDGRGNVLSHTDPSLIGKGADRLGIPLGKETGNGARASFPPDGEGYGVFLRPGGQGPAGRDIIAYAPIRFGEDIWTVAVLSPFDRVTAVIRRTFVNILLGAAGLILAVLVAGAVVARGSRKRLLLGEELKRLREREDWQEKLLREKKTMEGIIEGSPIPAFVIDRSHRVILWNRACADLTGYDAEGMIGTDRQSLPFYAAKRPLIADLIIDKDLAGLQTYYGSKEIRKAESLPGAFEARDSFGCLGGRPRHLYFLAAPIRDEKGDTIAAIETLQDVTRIEELTQHLRESAENLHNELAENIRLRREIEGVYNYLQSIVESLPDRLFDLSGEGTINFVSRRSPERAGDEPITGRHFLEFVAPELRDFMRERWEEARRGVFKPYEIEATAKDGRKRNLLITMRPVKGTGRFIIVQRDVTEFKTLERNLYESQKLAAVGQLSAGIAHEVRNALSSIKMSLRILEKRMQPEGNDRKRFHIAHREVEHLEALVSDVLVFAKPSDPKKEPSDLHRILERTLGMAEKGIREKQIQFRLVFAKDMPPLAVDPAMLDHVFLNLYRNATEAMEPGGILTVSTALTGDGRPRAIIDIRDTGCGIAEEDMPHLFNPFFTRKPYGTGLGLSQVKKIVDLHGGSVEIMSRQGEGTTVRITLPVGGEA